MAKVINVVFIHNIWYFYFGHFRGWMVLTDTDDKHTLGNDDASHLHSGATLLHSFRFSE